MKDFTVNLSENDFLTFSHVIDEYHEKCYNEIIFSLNSLKKNLSKDNKSTTSNKYNKNNS